MVMARERIERSEMRGIVDNPAALLASMGVALL